ncbi:MAG: competence/damage-inducible protein A [Actinobacteria bacterium]|nr:MAG: competence/damage-inducible protein A [Actinomycetota bacterium]TML65889.1 MAG: competence/damage-inducible protein A [Actinomycetota bacterium]
MRCDVLTIGTELLLGQIVDTNSSWIGEQLAAAGIDTFEHRKVGDNLDRIVAALSDMLHRADAVIVCGGLGPTQDDLTREAIALTMGVPLEQRDELVEEVAAMFRGRGMEMPVSNLRQAQLPRGASAISNPIGTAPGVKAEISDGASATKVIYAVPGVPHEMQLMMRDQVLPDLMARGGEPAVIMSRSLRTWGTSEAALGEMLAERFDTSTNPTIAFLARGIEGLYVRMTAKAPTDEEATALLDEEEKKLRTILGQLVFGVDDETMEHAVLAECGRRGWTLGVAESLTAGLVGARFADVVGASENFRGSIACYATDVKRSVLGVTAEQVVSKEAAIQMAEAAQRVLGADVGLAITGVAGPTTQEGQPVGTVWIAIAVPGRETEAVHAQLPGNRLMVRQYSTITLLNLARLRLLAIP